MIRDPEKVVSIVIPRTVADALDVLAGTQGITTAEYVKRLATNIAAVSGALPKMPERTIRDIER